MCCLGTLGDTQEVPRGFLTLQGPWPKGRAEEHCVNPPFPAPGGVQQMARRLSIMGIWVPRPLQACATVVDSFRFSPLAPWGVQRWQRKTPARKGLLTLRPSSPGWPAASQHLPEAARSMQHHDLPVGCCWKRDGLGRPGWRLGTSPAVAEL